MLSFFDSSKREEADSDEFGEEKMKYFYNFLYL